MSLALGGGLLLAAASCARLSRVEFRHGQDVAIVSQGVRLRPTDWLALDVASGYSFAVDEAGAPRQSMIQAGVTVHRGAVTIRGQVDLPIEGGDPPTAMVNFELEW